MRGVFRFLGGHPGITNTLWLFDIASRALHVITSRTKAQYLSNLKKLPCRFYDVGDLLQTGMTAHNLFLNSRGAILTKAYERS